MEIDTGDWVTMQFLRNHIKRQKELNSEEYRGDIKRDLEHLDYFKNKVIVK